MKLRTLLAALVLSLFASAAIAGGMFQGYPSATTITGAECIPADTNLPQGLTPQTECFSPTLLTAGNPSTLTDAQAGTVTPTLTSNNLFSLTLTGTSTARTMANISGAIPGARVTFALTQGGGGSNTVTWGSAYGWAGGTAPTLTTGVAAVDVVNCVVLTTALYSCVATLAVAH